jgi:hypothetical protein
VRRHSKAALAAAGVAGALAALSASGSAQTPQGRTLVFKEHHEVFRIIDNPPRSKTKGERASISIGDELIERIPLLDPAGNRAGTFHIRCVATKGAKSLDKATFLAVGEVVLHDGTIAATSVFTLSKGSGGGPIVGGTGPYQGAHGEFTFDLKAHTDTFTITP